MERDSGEEGAPGTRLASRHHNRRDEALAFFGERRELGERFVEQHEL